ncbi:DUF4326 domain-containing protein [Sinorhizobium sp. CCBAU 05631]|uniref:DUF4326 domain-containing protein n=1 Tax=Sinorhizobium sp. CCBAU 05631 TaxID=794846 RepID=UPI0004B8B7A1|nr:DUF4326 domain-containing protein [Sinorhizobium sp. CCBAU 05631]ASY56444.1 hypothetical protein SS05631_c15080 [Sinorhizobium sp. CCBAU 05631]
MTKPVRLQLSRRKGFDLQGTSLAVNGLAAVKVDRTTHFGNHYRVDRDEYATPSARWMVAHRCVEATFPSKREAIADAVERFRKDVSHTGPHNSRLIDPVPTRTDIIKALRGRNLACWCKPGAPCHADVLLEIANGPLCDEVGR